MEHSGDCAGTAAYNMSIGEALLVLQITIGALEYPKCWLSRVLLAHSEGCAGTEEYYRCFVEAVLVQKSTVGTVGRLCW